MPKQVNILHLYFLKVLLDIPNLLTIFLSREFNNYCWTFFANSIAGFNSFSGGISQSSLPKMLRTFSPKTSAFTSMGTPITSRHSLLEPWAFAQHWRSIMINLFDKSEFTCRETANSDWSFKIASDNLRIYSTTCLLASSSLLCKDSTKFFMSLLVIFPNDLFVYVAIFKPNSYQIRNTSCKVEIKILLQHQLRLHATVTYGDHKVTKKFSINGLFWSNFICTSKMMNRVYITLYFR